MASRTLKDFKFTYASHRVVLGFHVMHLKSFNARLAVDYPLLIIHFIFQCNIDMSFSKTEKVCMA